MEKKSDQILQDSVGLNQLMPSLADQQRVDSSVVHAEKKGEKNARSNNERRIRTHLLRLTRLLEHEGVEARVWNSAVKELILDADEIPESYWDQQRQIARDNGYGDIDLGRHEKDQITRQLQEAQRAGLESWRDYLESTGDQYPLWFKFYVWDGMSHLGTFNKQKVHYNKRSSGTVAPYPQLNPAALAKVFEAVKNKGADDLEVAQLIKAGNFNKIYSHMLLDQKAIISTPEKSENIHGKWREYTSEDIQAITEAAQGTPWCIAGRDMAVSYTRGGGKFLLFHLQDSETGVISPTAAASVRLDNQGQVVELSGLKGGAGQYVEDALIPTVLEKVKGLPGGEKYLQAFEDKQMLISMDKKFQNGEPFSLEELTFLYEADRSIKLIGRQKDPRIEQFKKNYQQHLQQIVEGKGISKQDAELFIWSTDYIEHNLRDLLDSGYNATIIANKLYPISRFDNLDQLIQAGADIDLLKLYSQFNLEEKLRVFTKLKELGADLDPDELTAQFSPRVWLWHFKDFLSIGADITANDVAMAFDEKGRFQYLSELVGIGAEIDAEKILKDLKPVLDSGSRHQQNLWLLIQQGAKVETILDLAVIDLGYRSDDLGDVTKQLLYSGLTSDEVMSFIVNAKKKADYNYGDELTGNLNTGDGRNKRIKMLLKSGIETDAILRSAGFGSGMIEDSLDVLLKAGADRIELMKALGAYFTSQHINEMIEAGVQISDIVEHIKPEPKFILQEFELLNEKEANLSIDEVVGWLNLHEVLDEIANVTRLKANIDVNDLLDNPEVGYIRPYQIDDLLAAGADPQKIAQKIHPIDVGYNLGDRHWERNNSNRNYWRNNYPKIYNLTCKIVSDKVKAGII
jgi:hypothetical protein